jgi:hypothetical protein
MNTQSTQKHIKNGIQRPCVLGVLKKVKRSERAASTLIILKKDGTVRLFFLPIKSTD